jgi:hypothetical protein
MTIGADYSFFSIEKVRQRGPGMVLRVKAAILGPKWQFTAALERARVDTGVDKLRQVSDFVACKSRRLEVPLVRGGWLRIKRKCGGRLVVRYRMCQAGVGAALEGEVGFAGESAERFCRELRQANK